MFKAALTISFAALIFPAGLSASTLTFESGGGCELDEATETATCIENGYSYQTSVNYAIPGTIYLHDDYGILSSRIALQNGGRFNASSAEIWGMTRLFQAIVGASPTGEREYLNDGQLMHLQAVPITYQVEGFRNGSLVASNQQAISINGPSFGAFSTVDWGNLFADVSALVVSLLLPDDRNDYAVSEFGWPNKSGPLEYLPLDAGEYYCEEWCGDLVIDSLEVSEVPLPPTLFLLGGAFALLGAFFRRSRSKGFSVAC